MIMISIIVAMARNRVIGRDNSLIWHLPADLKYFKKTTMGRPVIMGRKTFESVGKPLPGRTNIIVTRRRGYSAEGCLVAGSLEEAVEMAKGSDGSGNGPGTGNAGHKTSGSVPGPGGSASGTGTDPATGGTGNSPGGSASGTGTDPYPRNEIFIAGGGEIYRSALHLAGRMYITVVDADFGGDTLFPPIPEREWELIDEKHHPADDRNKYPMIFRVYDRK